MPDAIHELAKVSVLLLSTQPNLCDQPVSPSPPFGCELIERVRPDHLTSLPPLYKPAPLISLAKPLPEEVPLAFAHCLRRGVDHPLLTLTLNNTAPV